MRHAALSNRMSMLAVVLLCAAAMVPGARAAGRTLAQAFISCADYTRSNILIEAAQLSVPAQSATSEYMWGASLAEYFFVVATSQDSSTFGIDIYNAASEYVGGGNSERNGVGCYDGVENVYSQCPYSGAIRVDIFCKNVFSPCPVRLDLWTFGASCSEAAAAPATSDLDPGSSEPAIDPALQTPAEPDVLNPVPEPVSSSVPSSSTPSSGVSGSPTYYWNEGTSTGSGVIGIVVGSVLTAAIGGLAFWWYKRRKRLAASKMEHDIAQGVPQEAVEPSSKRWMGLASWWYKRRQRLALAKMEHDIGDSVPEKAVEPTSKAEMGDEEAGSEASDVVAHV